MKRTVRTNRFFKMNQTSPCYSAFCTGSAVRKTDWTQGGATAKNNRALCVAPLHSLWWTRAQRRPPRLDHLLDIGYPPKQSRIPDALSSTVTNPQRKTWFLYFHIEMKNRHEIKKVLVGFGSKKRGSFNLKQHNIELSGWYFMTFLNLLRTIS